MAVIKKRDNKSFTKSERIFWKKILNEFTDITGLKSSIVDSKGKILIKSIEDKDLSSYCKQIRSKTKGRKGCTGSHVSLASSVLKTKKPQLSECHANLVALGIPFFSERMKNNVLLIHSILAKKINKQKKDQILKFTKTLKLKTKDIEKCLDDIDVQPWIKEKPLAGLLTNFLAKLEQLTGTEEMEKEIGTINDENEIFDFFFSHCVDMMKVDALLVALIDDDQNLQYVRGHNISENLMNTFKIPLSVAFIERSILSEDKTFQVSNVEKKKRFTHVFVLQTKIKSFLAAPIKQGNKNLGILYACKFKPYKFSKSEEFLFKNLAGIVSNSIKKIRDHDELQKNSERFELIRRIMDQTFPTLDLNTLLTRVVDITSEIMNVEHCDIFLRTSSSEKKVICIAAKGELKEKVNSGWYNVGEGITGWIVKYGEVINTDNVVKDIRWKAKYKKNTVSYLGVPIYDNQEKYVQGVIRVSNKKGQRRVSAKTFSKGDEYLLTMVAKHISLAIDRNKLWEATQENSQLNLLRQIIPGIAHNLRFPLSQLIGYINMFSKDDKFKEYTHEMKDIEKLIFHLLLMIQNYMHFDFSLTQKDLLDIFDVNEAVNEIEKELNNISYFEDIEFEKELTEMPTQIMGIKPTIKIVLSNIMVNAIDSINRNKGKKGGKVHIKTERFLDNIRILISDNGQGIQTKNPDEIYRSFFSSKNSRGIGIGLTITKKIVDEYNGSIRFFSPGVFNPGTTFEINIPCTQGV